MGLISRLTDRLRPEGLLTFRRELRENADAMQPGWYYVRYPYAVRFGTRLPVSVREDFAEKTWSLRSLRGLLVRLYTTPLSLMRIASRAQGSPEPVSGMDTDTAQDQDLNSNPVPGQKPDPNTKSEPDPDSEAMSGPTRRSRAPLVKRSLHGHLMFFDYDRREVFIRFRDAALAGRVYGFGSQEHGLLPVVPLRYDGSRTVTMPMLRAVNLYSTPAPERFERFRELLAYAAGRLGPRGSIGSVRSVGSGGTDRPVRSSLTASVDQTGTTTNPERPARPEWSYLTPDQVRGFIRSNLKPCVPQPVARLYEQRSAGVEQVLTAFPVMACHGDLHSENILVLEQPTGEEPEPGRPGIAVIDYEHTGTLHLFYDLLYNPFDGYMADYDNGFFDELTGGRFDRELRAIFRPFLPGTDIRLLDVMLAFNLCRASRNRLYPVQQLENLLRIDPDHLLFRD